MTTQMVPVRLPKGLVESMDKLVESGEYASRSDVLRHAVRFLMTRKMVGILPDTGDSVEEVREIRRKLSKEGMDIDEINRL